jgi:hypothetical protein
MDAYSTIGYYFEIKYDELYLSLYSKKYFSTIASGATSIGSAELAPDDISWQALAHMKRRSVTPIGSEFYGCLKPEYFQSKFDCDMRFSSCVIAMKLECRDLSRRKDPGIRPVWPSIRTWMRSAGMYQCLRCEENPGGRTGYPENHWDSFFVSPKCGKRVGLTGIPYSNPRGLNLK